MNFSLSNDQIAFTNMVRTFADEKMAPYAKDWDEEKFLMTGRMDFVKQEEIQKAKQPIQVSYCGFGFCKVDTSLMKKMAYPYFTNKRVTIEREKQSYTENASEDVSFCLDSPVKPILDPNIIVGHVKEYII